MAARKEPKRDPFRELIGRPRPPEDEILKAGASHGQPEPGDGRHPLLRLLGPGLITGASDDDPTNIGVYSQIGAAYGFQLLWLFPLATTMLMGVQELSARIALQTGSGLVTNFRRKFAKPLVLAAILGLLVANLITIAADLRATAAGFALLTYNHIRMEWLVIPVAALIVGLQMFLSYKRLETFLKWLTLVLLAYLVEAIILHPNVLHVLASTVIPSISLNGNFVTAIVGVLGTTLSPYIFFWQASAEVDTKREKGEKTVRERRGTSGRELRHRRADVFIGMVVAQAVMYFLVLSTAVALHNHGKHQINSALEAAQALQPIAGQFAFIIFAIALIGTGLLAVPVLSASSAYVVGEFFNLPGTLGTKPRYRPTFYALIVIAMLAGTAMNFINIDPIKALFIASVIAGVISGPLLVLMVLVGSDRKLMRENTSRWLSKTVGWFTAAVMLACGLVVVLNLFQGKTGS